jgi:hypothetical protein
MLVYVLKFQFSRLLLGSRHIYTRGLKKTIYMQIIQIMHGIQMCPSSVKVSWAKLFPEDAHEDGDEVEDGGGESFPVLLALKGPKATKAATVANGSDDDDNSTAQGSVSTAQANQQRLMMLRRNTNAGATGGMVADAHHQQQHQHQQQAEHDRAQEGLESYDEEGSEEGDGDINREGVIQMYNENNPLHSPYLAAKTTLKENDHHYVYSIADESRFHRPNLARGQVKGGFLSDAHPEFGTRMSASAAKAYRPPPPAQSASASATALQSEGLMKNIARRSSAATLEKSVILTASSLASMALNKPVPMVPVIPPIAQGANNGVGVGVGVGGGGIAAVSSGDGAGAGGNGGIPLIGRSSSMLSLGNKSVRPLGGGGLAGSQSASGLSLTAPGAAPGAAGAVGATTPGGGGGGGEGSGGGGVGDAAAGAQQGAVAATGGGTTPGGNRDRLASRVSSPLTRPTTMQSTRSTYSEAQHMQGTTGPNKHTVLGLIADPIVQSNLGRTFLRPLKEKPHRQKTLVRRQNVYEAMNAHEESPQMQLYLSDQAGAKPAAHAHIQAFHRTIPINWCATGGADTHRKISIATDLHNEISSKLRKSEADLAQSKTEHHKEKIRAVVDTKAALNKVWFEIINPLTLHASFCI